MALLTDNYPISNRNTDASIGESVGESVGQSFTGSGNTLDSVVFYLVKFNSPVGTAKAKIYAHSGTFGTSSVGSGVALATSTTELDVSTLTTSPSSVTFSFTGNDKITLENGTKYVVVVETTSSVSGGFYYLAVDSSSPTHNGNLAGYFSSSWYSQSGMDIIFYVYVDEPLLKDIIQIGIIPAPRS